MESKRTRGMRQAGFAMSLMAVAGVLIWAKLRLVTNIPRSAYAEPDRAQVEDGVDRSGTPDGWVEVLPAPVKVSDPVEGDTAKDPDDDGVAGAGQPG